jgi:hypothetical protein
VKKLAIRDNHRVAAIHAPDGFARTLGELPAGVRLHTRLTAKARFDVILYFVDMRSQLRKDFCRLARHLTSAGGLWICWPKKASGVPTDVSEDLIREIGLDAGLVDNKVCAVDDIWSGLRFVTRVADRPKRSSPERQE